MIFIGSIILHQTGFHMRVQHSAWQRVCLQGGPCRSRATIGEAHKSYNTDFKPQERPDVHILRGVCVPTAPQRRLPLRSEETRGMTDRQVCTHGGTCRPTTLISHNVLIKWFWKVNSPTKPSTHCSVNNKYTALWGS